MRDLARHVDHTLLRADATAADVDRLVDEALAHGFYGVCVHGAWVARAARRAGRGGPKVVAVAGFPHGASARAVKVFEARRAVDDGAAEVDVVIARGALAAGDDAYVRDELAEVVAACHERHAAVKAILETAALDDDALQPACALAVDAGADFVKTSTGFGPGGATVEVVARMRALVGVRVGVKASGGIRTAAQAGALLAAGADRLGTSASVALVTADD